MEESVPLESAHKKKFEKTVSGIKKLIKTGKLSKPGKVVKSKFKKSGSRGVVYVGHIPHGFYEEQMRDFFKQFGKVTNVRVARSKRNGHSKGYGFVEFQERDVAEIVAETMNNYLMDKRLLKAECILPERELPNLFKGVNWTEKSYPGLKIREESIKNFNKNITHEEWIKDCKRQLHRIHVTKTKLKDMGIEFDFTPCDVPTELKDYDPSTVSKNNLRKKKINKSKKKKSLTNTSEKSPVGKNSKKTKEKSMKKITPLVKPPKIKKITNRPFIGVLAPPKDDAEEIVKKDKKNKTKVKNTVKETTPDKISKKNESKLHKKKDLGGIKKNKKKDKENILKSDKVKSQAKAMLQSNLVEVIQKPKTKPSDKKIKRKQK